MSEPIKERFSCLLESVGSICKKQIKNEQQLILFNYKVQGEKKKENILTNTTDDFIYTCTNIYIQYIRIIYIYKVYIEITYIINIYIKNQLSYRC